MLRELMENPRVLSEEEIEKFANELVKDMGKNDMTYEQAYKYFVACQQVFDEAKHHLGHNAALEMGDKGISFMLEGY